jgi:DNA polymerase
MPPDNLQVLAGQVRTCTLCRLAETRTFAVPGHGDPAAPLMLVAEAPGAKEDATGLPFQGMAGRFLNRCLADLGVVREQLYITSTNKCRPPGNRAPKSDEMAACAGYLDRQLALVDPRVVLAMGSTAARRLHPLAAAPTVRLADLRGAGAIPGGGRQLLVTYHPAAAMRFPAQRQPFTDDLRAACELAGLVAFAGS